MRPGSWSSTTTPSFVDGAPRRVQRRPPDGPAKWLRAVTRASCRRSGSCGGPCSCAAASRVCRRRTPGQRRSCRRRPRPARWARAPCGDLHMLTVLTLAPILFVVEFDVEEVDGAVEPFQAGQLLGDVVAEVVGNFDVATRDHHLGVGGGFGPSGRPSPLSCLIPRNNSTYLATRFPFVHWHGCACRASKEIAPTGHTWLRHSPVQGVDYSPPTAGAISVVLSAAVSCSRMVCADGSPCSPRRATNLADLFSTLHTRLICGQLVRFRRVRSASTATTCAPEVCRTRTDSVAVAPVVTTRRPRRRDRSPVWTAGSARRCCAAGPRWRARRSRG